LHEHTGASAFTVNKNVVIVFTICRQKSSV